MSASREDIELALFNKLKNALGSQFKTIGRKHVAPPTLLEQQQPALFVQGVLENKDPGPRGLPGKRTITYLLFVYCTDDSADAAPGEETGVVSTTLNDLKDAIDAALAGEVATRGAQTLGGKVSHCWIEGDAPQDPGIAGKQAFVIIPVKVLVP